jgi:hypothetical protein
VDVLTREAVRARTMHWPSLAAYSIDSPTPRGREATMLTTILVILVVLWLLGMVSSYTLGGFIHLLLVLAIALFLIRIIQGRRPI